MPSIDIDGLRVAYEDAGTGLPIVFIPGLTGTREWFKYQFRGLRESYRIISYDVRAARSVATYTLDLLTEDLERLLTALKIDSAVIAGHSFGAMIAQKFAATYYHRVDALVLISAFPYLPNEPGETILSWISGGSPPTESRFRSLVRRVLHMKPPTVPDDVDDLVWLAAHSIRPAGVTIPARMGLVQKFDSSRWMSQIEAPTLVIAGSEDRVPFLTAAQELYEGIPDATLEVVEGGGHFCFLTNHDVVNGAIDDFLMERLLNP